MALVQRASACIRQGRFTAAVDDLDHAVADGRRGQFDERIVRATGITASRRHSGERRNP
jgi:hypothetical protein